ncbi:DUF4190 domain-containing protein [Aeromicrobium sp. YIM 150415]|nr:MULTISPECIES: DUF4190 domain-containing protein [Aeromicrobium]MBM9464289.1 DUF4190 domain-containing protein [Aeromicrobium sp. YIM 150415]
MSTQYPPPGGDQNPNEPSSDLPSYGSTEGTSGGYPPPPPGGGYNAPGGYAAPQGNNTKALWSMILGIVSIVCCGLFAGIPAFILAQMARKEIAQTGQGGSGMATAGWWLGLISIVLSAISLVLYATGVLTFDFNSSTTY